MIGTVTEADALQRFHGQRSGIFPGNGSRHGDVFQRGEFRQQMIILENVADALVPKTRLLLAAHGVEVRAINADTALFRVLQSGERV